MGAAMQTILKIGDRPTGGVDKWIREQIEAGNIVTEGDPRNYFMPSMGPSSN